MGVTVYSSDNCMQCKYTKELLEREGVPYKEKNISESETHKNEVLAMGFRGVPVTIVVKDDQTETVLGFNPDSLKRAVGL